MPLALDTTELRIATRSSPLALWQANHVAEALCQLRPDVEVRLVPTSTHADRRLDTPISTLGGKGAFSKEIQFLVLADEADIAVHSAKDLQAVTPDGLLIAAFPERGDPRDALVGAGLGSLGSSSMVGTGSNRRQALLADLCPGVGFGELRGNIATRLAKAVDFDAVIVAMAAIERLGLTPDLLEPLDPARFVPQVGQGALAVEVRDPGGGSGRDGEIAAIVAQLNHDLTAAAVTAERHFLAELGGDCTLPAGAHATVTGDGGITIDGILADEDRFNLQRLTVVGRPEAEPGRELARRLRKQLEAAIS